MSPPPRLPAAPEAPRAKGPAPLAGATPTAPFRALRALDAPETRAWIDAQDARTDAWLGADPVTRALTEAGLAASAARPDERLVRRVGERSFRHGPGPSGPLCVEVSDAAGTRPLLDLAQEAPATGNHHRLDSFSSDGRLAALSIDHAGSDTKAMRIVDVETGALRLELPPVLAPGVAFTPDGEGLYHHRGVSLEGGDPAAEGLYLHQLGTDPSTDVLIAPRAEGAHASRPVRFDGLDALFVLSTDFARGTSGLAVTGLEPGGALRPVLELDAGHRLSPVGRLGDRALFLTTADAPRGRVVAIDPSQPGPDHWETIVPESAGALETDPYPLRSPFATVVGEHVAVTRLEGAAHRVALYGADGAPAGEVPFPRPVSVSGIEADPDGTLRIATSSFQVPHEVFR